MFGFLRKQPPRRASLEYARNGDEFLAAQFYAARKPMRRGQGANWHTSSAERARGRE